MLHLISHSKRSRYKQYKMTGKQKENGRDDIRYKSPAKTDLFPSGADCTCISLMKASFIIINTSKDVIKTLNKLLVK